MSNELFLPHKLKGQELAHRVPQLPELVAPGRPRAAADPIAGPKYVSYSGLDAGFALRT